MPLQEAIWENADAWRDARYSPAYAEYLKSSLLPTQRNTEELRRAQEVLWKTPIVQVILGHQAQDGSWPLGGPPWFRVYPRPLLVLLEYGRQDHPSVRRGVEYLLSTIDRNKFVWPRAEPYDPKDFYIRHQGAALQVMARAGLSEDPRVQAVARRLAGLQRWDGGWSTKPGWMYGKDEAKVEPLPSCWICTLDLMRGLGMINVLSRPVVEKILRFWEAHLEDQRQAAVAVAQQTRTNVALAETYDVGLILACTEFCADQHVNAEHLFVRHLLDLLSARRGPDGTIPGLSGYFEVMARHLQYRLHA